MPREADVEGILKAMISSSEVWFPLLSTLHPQSAIMKHPKVLLVMDALKLLTNPLRRPHLPFKFFLRLKDEDINLLAMFCALASTLEPNEQQHKVEEWKAQLTSVRSDAQTIRKRLSELEQTIRFIEEVSQDIVVVSDANSLILEVNIKRKAMNKATLEDVLDVTFWGELSRLIDSEEETMQVQQSVIFSNVARRCLTEEFAGSPGAVEEVADIPVDPISRTGSNREETAAAILCLLKGKGLHQFDEVCTSLFDGCKDSSIKEVDMLLCGIDTEDDLKRELIMISSIRGGHIPQRKMTMLKHYLHFPTVRVKVEQLMSVFSALGFDSNKDAAVTKDLQDFISSSHAIDLTLSQLSEMVENKSVFMVNKTLDETLTSVITTLQESSELISFIKETAGEDIRILIDAVEEHSDQFVSEATVSDLIDVHGFLGNVLRETSKDPLMFLSRLQSFYSVLEKKEGMPAKIKECGCNVHSLRGLYMNVANRGEMTKEIIINAVQRGCYLIKSKSDGSCDVQLSYYRQEGASKETTYNMAELHDLRSRALLIVNTDKKQETKGKSEDCDALNTTLSKFIHQVEKITDILNTITLLRESGHPKFNETFWSKLSSSEEIKSLASSLEAELRVWENILHVLQKEHYFLNFFHPDQLWILHAFFSRPLTYTMEGVFLKKSVHSLLCFVDPSIKQGDLDDFHCHYKVPKKNSGDEANLRAIGEVLDAIFIPRQTTKLQKVAQHDLHRTVKPGELFVAVLEQGSRQTAHVVMSLFENTAGSYPLPNQVLFCHSENSWEEVERLLKRAFEAHGHSTVVKLHCLANVESLSNDMQFELVAAIKSYQQSAKGPYLLSIVCCGGINHHIADQFSAAAHNVMGMTEVQLRTTLKNSFPEVFMVTSDLPGVGKTEAIHEHAASQRKKAVTFPISGPLTRKTLVKRLSYLHFGPHDCIHFDIGEVDDPSVLDIFIFELVVVGMVSSGTDLFHLPIKHVYIEIANTLRHWLQDSLPVTKCFCPLHIKLDGYKDLVVSQESLSPIQVISQYLDAFESGKLESKELRLEELKPLPPERCKMLLSKYFSSSGDLSYNVVESFIKVFANQLLQFSASPYFKPHNLRAVLGPSHHVRNCLFKALLEVSREFASRSVVTCKSVQSEAVSKEQATEVLKKIQSSSKNVAEKMVERVEGMIQWADNNHLVIAFHSLEALTISALYRDLSLVPSNVHELFKTQAVKGKGMDDFTKMGQKELQQRLDRIVRTTPREKDDDLQSLGYALTPDNILKMVLIIQRIRAGIPVIVMGETGCGKTSLVRYLARTCGVPFHVKNFHAGVSEEELVAFAQQIENEAKSGVEVWVFLDEINTCEYLGTINEMICHRSIKGKPLMPNLVLIAACNPYRLRPPGKISTAGLGGKTITDEFSRLVYRVHPLPETMIDFVWDYGSLSKEDERAYIGRMVEGVTGNPNNLLVDLLCTSQEYIREVDKSPYCVSLRDAHRCIVLVKWFKETLQKRKDLTLSHFTNSRKYHTAALSFSYGERSFILALAHCYQARLPTAVSRKEYREQIVHCFREHKNFSFKESSFEAIVRAEQEDYLERMELPEGTAKNAALRENIFVMLVCILNRIPVFVVGKPGCSKSLSMQVIRSNLRGKDAKDPFLKTLPQLYVVSHQGSESSTSDGILKVFQKARKYREHNKTGDILPVVLLDEIGLAEISKYNPLKVLHSLLEPSESMFPDVAVVGISNWALDAAKMNRAIHLSRPEPDVEDLFETGKSLREAKIDKNGLGVSRTRSGHQFGQGTYPDDKQLRCLAEAYQNYQVNQRYPNFHGLRDYYSLIKCISTEPKYDASEIEFSEERTKGIQHALQRNFGGLPKDVNNFQSLFLEGLQIKHLMEESYHFPVAELICDNLHDKLARHLMIITNGDSAIGILDHTLQSLHKEKITIFGSRFEEDLSEEYNYRILSRIILCMERGCVLILRDLESIYGSLYDMLNQNYTVVGGKRNCRVALGAFSNPMCQVHDGFRCIVLIDQGRVDFTDPPFLNRFEKQLLRFSDVLNDGQRNVINDLTYWVKGISTIPDSESQFHEEDMFVGFCDDTLPSLVLKNSQEPEHNRHEILEQCKQDLMMVASPDGVVRSLQSALAKTDLKEVQTLYDSYFQKPLHNGFKIYLKHLLENLQFDSGSEDATDGMRLVVMTHSNIHVNVSQCLDGLVNCQTEKLSAFKSEKQLTRELERFWISSDPVLVLQCKPELDATHMLLAKSIIEQQREKHVKEVVTANRKEIKHVCIIIHVQRESDASEAQNQRWQFSFQSGWQQVTIDVLEDPVLSITECLDVSIMDLLESKALSFEDVASNHFLWCFTRIKYPAIRQPSLDTILQLEKVLTSSPKILECFKELVKWWLTKRAQDDSDQADCPSWQYSVACDRQALINSSHLVGAIQHHVSHLIRRPLAKIIYFLEKASAWPRFLFTQDTLDEEELHVWLKLMLDKDICNIDDIPDHQGAESYFIPEQRLELRFPCMSVFYKKVEQVQPMFAEDQRRLLWNESNLDENEELHDVAAESQLHRFASVVMEKIPQIAELEYLQRNIAYYVEDLLDLKTVHFSSSFTRAERIDFLKSAMARHIKFVIGSDPALLITRLHCLFWLNEPSYMAALQAYETCHKVPSLGLDELFSKYTPVFEEILFQDKTSAQSEAFEDTQDPKESIYAKETLCNENVNVIVEGDNQKTITKLVIDENCLPCTQSENESQSPKGPEGEVTEAGEERDVLLNQVIDMVCEVNRVESLKKQVQLVKAGNTEDQDGEQDETQTEGGVDSITGHRHECFSEVDGYSLSEVDNSDGNQTPELDKATGECLQGNKLNEEDEGMKEKNTQLYDIAQEQGHVKEDGNVRKHSDETQFTAQEESISEEDESEEAGQEVEESIGDGEEEADVSFDEELVETLCSALLPTDDVVNNFKGPDNWQRTTGLFLSTVSRMQVQIPAFHYLRVCFDFVTLLVLPEDLELYSLYMLGALGKTGASEGYLDSLDIFNSITGVTDELQKRGVQSRRLVDFLMLFYGRCIDSNPDTPVLGFILERICSSGDALLMHLAGPLVHRVFLMEEQLCPGVFEKLLHSFETIKEHPGLQEISYALEAPTTDVELDSPFAVVCCDLICEVAFFKVDFSLISSSEDQILLNFRKGFQTLVDTFEDQENGVFHLLCATAYLRSFLTSFVHFILQHRRCLVEDGEFSMLMNEINAAFVTNQSWPFSSRVSALRMYFLKELRKELYMFDVHEICQRSYKLPALKSSLDWEEEILIGKLSFDPFQKYTENSAQAALATLLEKNNPKPLEDVITTLPKSAKTRFEMAAVLTKTFYLVRSKRPLWDSEDKAIDSFKGKLLNLETPYVELLLRITGRKDFKCRQLCISSECSPADLHKATLILHLCLIVASGFSSTKKNTFAFMSYLTNPLVAQNSFVLASGESPQQPHNVHCNYSAERFGQTTTFLCVCGTMFVTSVQGDKKKCPSCRTECEGENKSCKDDVIVKTVQPSTGFVSAPISVDISCQVRELKPAEFRILHLLVYASLCSGYSLELFDEKCLSQILSTDQLESSPSEVCFCQIEDDLKALCDILDAKEEDVIRFLHCALEECTSLLTSAVLCLTQDLRLAWERKFAAALGPLLHEFCPRKQLVRSEEFASRSPLAVQRKIEETDCPVFSDTDERNQQLPRLFRVTCSKTFSSLRAYYMAAKDEERNSHPLLGLFLNYNDILPLVANLNDLLSWSRIVDSLLSRRLTRKDAASKIGDIIRGKATSAEEKKRLDVSFDKFNKSWEAMRPYVKEQLDIKEVPYLSESSPISFCLVEKSDKGVFLCAALEVLQNIQNEFLRKMLSIAATGKCSALVFLERDEGNCAIPMVHLQEAREKEIIQYQWSDDILRHSQRNTEYGHGKEIFFDLAKIERELAARFLVGKSFLSTSDGLQEFIFSGELFHTCRSILDDLQEMIPQQPLTDVFRSSLRQGGYSLENVQDLLEHMEIVLCLLKRHKVGKPEESLTEFTGKWLSGSRPFPKALLPQPHSAIQLTHVVALYEFLEDTLAESAAKSVHSMYRATIPEEIAEEMTKAAPTIGKAEEDRSLLNAVATALRRFIFRYLSSEDMRLEAGESLVERMLESSLWPIDAFKSWKSLKVESSSTFIRSVFPEKLTVGHTHQVLSFYQERLKVSKK